MTATAFTWQRVADPAGLFYRLSVAGFGAERVSGGYCYRRDCGRRWAVLIVCDAGNVRVERGTPQAAIREANRELDRRSIGLLGVDDLTFAMAVA